MNIDQILDTMDELLDKGWNFPLSGGRCVVDADKVRKLIDDIRMNMPNEIKQAQAIVLERNEILSAAKREAEQVIRKAEERAKHLIAQQEIYQAAQTKAADTVSQSQIKSREIRQAAQDFSDDVLRTTEDSLSKALSELRGTRQALRNSGKK